MNADKKECWMVEGVPIERGQETPRFGPFKNEEEAQTFASRSENYFAYDLNNHKPGFRRHA